MTFAPCFNSSNCQYLKTGNDDHGISLAFERKPRSTGCCRSGGARIQLAARPRLPTKLARQDLQCGGAVEVVKLF